MELRQQGVSSVEGLSKAEVSEMGLLLREAQAPPGASAPGGFEQSPVGPCWGVDTEPTTLGGRGEMNLPNLCTLKKQHG